jgi:tetratricopeptide (TPR) repeat protein
VPDERRVALEERLALACFCLNEFQASGDAYERAARLADDGARAAVYLGNASWSLLWGHHYARGVETAAEALALAREHGSDAAQAIALNDQAFSVAIIKGVGDGEMIRIAREGTVLAEGCGDREARLRLLGQAALWSEMRGQYRRAIDESERALGLARGMFSLDPIYAGWALALSLGCLGQYGRSLDLLREALGFCDRIGDRAMKARILNTIGWCYAEFGCHRIARGYNEQATALGRELVELKLVAGAPELHANGSINLACNLIASGDVDGAMEHLGPIRETLDRPGDPWMCWRYSMHLHDALARASLARGEPEQALTLLARELVDARRHAARKMEARTLELRGRALLTMDDRPEATEELRAALEVASAIEYAPVIWRSHSLLAEVARRNGDRSEADGHAARVTGLVGELARLLPEADLQREFTHLGERLVTDPLGAYR